MEERKFVKSSTKRPSQEEEKSSIKFCKVNRQDEKSLNIEEFYTLPKQLLRPPVPLRVRKEMAKKGKLKAANREAAARLKSYTAMRKEREEFRKKLVSLIIKPEDDLSSPTDIPSAEEKEVLRYYYYIHHGVDTVHVTPLEPEWLEKINKNVPEYLRMSHAELHQQLIEEVEEEFVLSIKKAIVDFALQDPNECDNRILEFDSQERQELRKRPKSWKNSFQQAYEKIHKNLHVLNTCLAQVLDLWFKTFRYK
ncbi:hypothetical protein L9F63_017055 [Diploptera punctata]|uniref:Uncharacterized protein n=1 Tax=Diploptera punctata TaxID=6984 RepID=A0AAD8EGS2_DIPPU|nr:hypothetical protein L9F63_017055 [Diploptera punctata]